MLLIKTKEFNNLTKKNVLNLIQILFSLLVY